VERQDAHAGRLCKEDPGTRSRPLKGLVDVPYGGRLDVAERCGVALRTACADVDVPHGGRPEQGHTCSDGTEQHGLYENTTYHSALLSMRRIVANSCSCRPRQVP